MENLLNLYQRGSVEISLRRFEKSLRNALSILDGEDASGFLFTRRIDISEEKRGKAREMINFALDQIREMKELFAFHAEEQDLARQIAGDMSISWESLMDIRAKKLKRYGEVHPQLAEILDPQVKSLSSAALKIAALFEENAD